MKSFVFVLMFLQAIGIVAQVGIGTVSPHASSVLDITTTRGGLLMPRMLEGERIAINNPAESLLVYQTDGVSGFYVFKNGLWHYMDVEQRELVKNGNIIYNVTSPATDDFVIGSNALDDVTGTNDDNRLFFDKSKGAFRAGRSSTTAWNNNVRGSYSAGFGLNTQSSGTYALAAGLNNWAAGLYSFAMGTNSRATGEGAVTIGRNNFASGRFAVALGSMTRATARYATALGVNTNATREAAMSTGVITTAQGYASFTSGIGTSANSYAETTIGSFNEFYTPAGINSFHPADRVFSIGIGTSFGGRRNAVTVFKNGNIGIGTTNATRGKLVVEGTGNTQNLTYAYLRNTGLGFGSGNSTYSIYSTGNIAAAAFYAFSDRRIKDIKGLSNIHEDLEVLSKIEITDYTMKDTIANGDKKIKKVIAQQLKKVYPIAVETNHSEFIPNIYTLAKSSNGVVSLQANSILQHDDVIKIITASGEKIEKVLDVQENSFSISGDHSGEIFIYGVEVDDFHTVDYEALITLNISATQALLHKIEALESENYMLKSLNANFRKQVSKRLYAIENKLNVSNSLKNESGAIKNGTF